MGSITLKHGDNEVNINLSDVQTITVNSIPTTVDVTALPFDHSLAINLSTDDHPQYFNTARGDARYLTKTEATTDYLTLSTANSLYVTPALGGTLYAPLSHTNDTNVHYTMGDISIAHTQVQGMENYVPVSHANDSSIHFTMSEISINASQVSGIPTEITSVDHSLATNLDADDHPQYLNNTRGDSRYTPLGHSLDLSTHFTMGEISISTSQITDINTIDTSPTNIYTQYHANNPAVFNTARQTKLDNIPEGNLENNLTTTQAQALTGSGDTTLHYHASDRDRSNHTGTQDTTTVSIQNPNGDTVTVGTLSELLTKVMASSVLNVPNVINNFDGTVSVTNSVEYILNDTGNTVLLTNSIAPQINISVGDGVTTYLYVDYSVPTPVWSTTTDISIFDTYTNLLVATITRDGTDLSILNQVGDTTNSASNLAAQSRISGFVSLLSGAAIDATNLQFTVGTGNFIVNNQITTHTGKNLLTTVIPYYEVNGVWSKDSITDSVDPLNYNDVTTGMVSVPDNAYKTTWVYAVLGDPLRIVTVHGQTTFDNISKAIKETPPDSLPPIVESTGTLIGAIVTKQDLTEVQAIRSSISGNLFLTYQVPQSGWIDLRSPLSASGVPNSNAPTRASFGNSFTDGTESSDPYEIYQFAIDDYLYVEPLHINHDMKPDGQCFLHIHWSHSGGTVGNVAWKATIRRSLRSGSVRPEGTSFKDVDNQKIVVIEASTSTLDGEHVISEVIDVSDIMTLREPDEVFLVTLRRISPSTNPYAGNVYGIYVDFHLEVDRQFTPNKVSNFY